jgi:hypothetical protein
MKASAAAKPEPSTLYTKGMNANRGQASINRASRRAAGDAAVRAAIAGPSAPERARSENCQSMIMDIADRALVAIILKPDLTPETCTGTRNTGAAMTVLYRTADRAPRSMGTR